MNRNIDYSKWDTLSVSSDDSESKKTPTISRFEGPTSVTFGGLDASASCVPTQEDGLTLQKHSNTEEQLTNEVTADFANGKLFQYVRNGGFHENPFYFWNQTLYNVTAYVAIPVATSSKNIRLNISETCLSISLEISSEATLSSISAESCSSISSQINKKLLYGEFPYPVKAAEEDWIWEIKRMPFTAKELKNSIVSLTIVGNENSVALFPPTDDTDMHLCLNEEAPLVTIEITLLKKQQIENVFVWWNCLLKGHTSIDVTKIKDRLISKKQNIGTESLSSSSRQSTSFKDVWDEAHAKFLEKMKNKGNQKIVLNFPEAGHDINGRDSSTAEGDFP
ncbi:hypothetical protein IE077_001701 [Cardiosporidium cionae]|uniref:CS domain-containing protein n=1 Tax=Cardiosporidium cionae TaxID=476202 RepID=A0ABQ7JCF2_9APIC|nr:hypothetical protein IE077_001701 [Cardiosporidium cionae]|eukprot:KAF8821708.1 hypothetical protein IE077_001701 [Cardiosporidium cionae]